MGNERELKFMNFYDKVKQIRYVIKYGLVILIFFLCVVYVFHSNVRNDFELKMHAVTLIRGLSRILW